MPEVVTTGSTFGIWICASIEPAEASASSILSEGPTLIFKSVFDSSRTSIALTKPPEPVSGHDQLRDLEYRASQRVLSFRTSASRQ